ncbi:hypothetical protein ERJ75_001043400 [Trypanosoma vivax]|uniref:Uncharacterized protein n=1 Tax=Trypanosoma vivax (strain Y486) TaxID=1055687 RepID=G0TZS4_TRYVY|nr:hypothetical protein TRVL_04382 [Trypanosoma vivax]KAH8610896.1 hypothetical protein ERJ75_001043400 [Trypanosoma vivax]CCC50102.1 conserved hypothetical protein [Trypanosoma vivax Y486]
MLGGIQEGVVHGDVVERLNPEDQRAREDGTSTLRPVRALVGTPFPRPDAGRCYGYITSGSLQGEAQNVTTNGTVGHAASDSTYRFTAHVQPPVEAVFGSGTGRPMSGAIGPGGGPISSMSRQHQWNAEDFEDLEHGFYMVDHLAPARTSTNVRTGEAYVELLVLFLSSTVRKHRECAMATLHQRLSADKELRRRFLHGHDCAQLVHLIIRELSTSGHTAICTEAAECLALLLYDITREVTEVVGEIGCPTTDICKVGSREVGGEMASADVDDSDATFAALSESMQSADDRPYALEKLGLTKAVMNALELLPPALVARLLLGSGVVLIPHVAARIASDPRFVTFASDRIGATVLGRASLSDVLEELLLLYRILQIPKASQTILSSLYEKFVLLVRYVCELDTETLTPPAVMTVLLVFLVLRVFVRHGHSGPFNDTIDVLLSATVAGACIPAEMWLLAIASADSDGKEPASTAVEHFGAEFSQEAVRVLLRRVCKTKSETSTAPAGASNTLNCVGLVAQLTCTHFLATVFSLRGGSVSWRASLLATGSDSDGCLEQLLETSALSPDGLRHAFIRLDDDRTRSALVSASCNSSFNTELRLGSETGPTREVTLHTTFNLPLFEEACWASLTHARARLIASVFNAQALNRTSPHLGLLLEYAAALSTVFQEKCLRLKNASSCLMPDEICTMVVVVELMRQRVCVSHDNGVVQRSSKFRRLKLELHTTELFLIHCISITKHGLDAVTQLVDSILVGLVAPDVCPSASCLSESMAFSVPPESELGSYGALRASLQRSVIQREQSWFLYPLYDATLPSKAEWCLWIRQALLMHPSLKDVLRWDLILCHALKWSLCDHKRFLSWEETINHSNDGAGLPRELLDLLDELCYRVLPSSSGTLSSAASDVVKQLVASSVPHSEGSMKRGLFEALVLVCTACEPSAAVSILRLLLCTSPEEESCDCDKAGSSHSLQGPSVSAALVGDDFVTLMSRWAATGTLNGNSLPEEGAHRWDLHNFVELLELVGIAFGRGYGEQRSSDVEGGVDNGTKMSVSSILLTITEGVSRRYLWNRTLSEFECQILSKTVEDSPWCPPCLLNRLRKAF